VKEAISRRSFTKLLGIAAVGSVIRPHESQEPASPPTAAKFDERQLALYVAALRGNRSAAASRLRHKLPENSEPCTLFFAETSRK
jgi:hypothetical protein